MLLSRFIRPTLVSRFFSLSLRCCSDFFLRSYAVLAICFFVLTMFLAIIFLLSYAVLTIFFPSFMRHSRDFFLALTLFVFRSHAVLAIFFRSYAGLAILFFLAVFSQFFSFSCCSSDFFLRSFTVLAIFFTSFLCCSSDFFLRSYAV